VSQSEEFLAKEVLMHDLRMLIIREFLDSGRVPTRASIAQKIGCDVDALHRDLETTPRLATLQGLSPEQARQLVDAFGKGVLFDASIESSLERLGSIRKEIEDREKKHK
jgi:hypothetical protein